MLLSEVHQYLNKAGSKVNYRILSNFCYSMPFHSHMGSGMAHNYTHNEVEAIRVYFHPLWVDTRGARGAIRREAALLVLGTPCYETSLTVTGKCVFITPFAPSVFRHGALVLPIHHQCEAF